MSRLTFDPQGWMVEAQHIESLNCDERPPDTVIDLVVIHNISLPPGEFGGDGVIDLFTNRLNPDEHPYYRGIYQRKVSAHFFIRRDGALIQFVSCDKRAWHAGVSEWQGRERCNDFSIGIELEGADDAPFEDVQYLALTDLLAAIRKKYPISAMAGHSDIAPGRKTDPGLHFDWARLK